MRESEPKQSQVHPGHENIYIRFIYIKCLISSNMYTLHRMSGEWVPPKWSSASLSYIQIIQGRKEKISKLTKMCNLKSKGSKSWFSSTNVLRSTSTPDFHKLNVREICSLPQSTVVHIWSGRKSLKKKKERKKTSQKCWSRAGASSLVDDLVDGGLLVTRSCYNVFVICWDVTAQNRGRLLRLWK